MSPEENKEREEPLRLSSVPGEDGQATFLVVNDETGDPVMCSEKEVEQNRRFNALLAAVQQPTVTYALLVMNVAVFVLMAAMGISFTNPAPGDVLKWGADYGPLALHGEWWRMVTSIFLHFGIVHLGMNMFFLFIIGRFAERLFGHVGFTALYLLAGIGGNLASLYWQPVTIGAGASGAIFGIYGGVLGFVLLQPRLMPRHRMISIGRMAVGFVAYQLLYGFVSNLNQSGGTRIDLAAHIGGAVSGLLVGGALARARVQSSSERQHRMTAAIVAASLALAALIAWRLPAYDDFRGEIERFGKLEKDTLKIYADSLTKTMQRKMTPEDFQKTVQGQVLGPWNAERVRLAKMKFPQPQQAFADKLARYMGLRAKAWDLYAQGVATKNAATFLEAMKTQQQVQALVRELNPQSVIHRTQPPKNFVPPVARPPQR